jgi:exodeoxyribonuclease V alpha subunit
MPENILQCEIEAQVERVTYYNEDNHYHIAKVKIEGRKSLITVVGTLYSIVPG